MSQRPARSLPVTPGRYLIGLTGNIATGKSTVAEMLAELGATVVDADKVVHQLMQPGHQVYEHIVAAFGPKVTGPDGEIDRAQLGTVVFNDPAQLRRLESITHPAAAVEVGRRIADAATSVVVVEAIKLIEAGWHHTSDALWVTTCPEEQQIKRLMTDRSLSLEEARARVAAQPPQMAKVRLADVVIDTSGDLAGTCRQVKVAWQAIGRGGSHGHTTDVHRHAS